MSINMSTVSLLCFMLLLSADPTWADSHVFREEIAQLRVELQQLRSQLKTQGAEIQSLKGQLKTPQVHNAGHPSLKIRVPPSQTPQGLTLSALNVKILLLQVAVSQLQNKQILSISLPQTVIPDYASSYLSGWVKDSSLSSASLDSMVVTTDGITFVTPGRYLCTFRIFTTGCNNAGSWELTAGSYFTRGAVPASSYDLPGAMIFKAKTGDVLRLRGGLCGIRSGTSIAVLQL